MKKFKATLQFGLTLVLTGALATPPSAWAALGSAGPTPQVAGCDNFCGVFDQTWTKADDQWCADHGSQTNPAVLPSTNPQNPGPAGTCNITLFAGEDCVTANQKLQHCQLKNTQVETQCMAYNTAGHANWSEWPILTLDLGVAATCGAICAGIVTNATLGPVCNIAAMGAGAADVAASFALNSGAVGKLLGSIPGIVGIGEGAAGEWAKKKGANLPCYTAATFAIMTGVRAYLIDKENAAKGKACDAVKSLFGSAPSASGSTTTAGTNGSYGTMLTSGTTGSGPTSGSTGSSNPSQSANQGLTCIQNGGTISSCVSGTGGVTSAATDGNILSRSGLDRALVPIASQLDVNALAKRLAAGEGAGSVVGSMMGNSGDVGRALSALAQGAQDQAPQLLATAGMGGVSSALMAGGGGAPGGGAGAKSPDFGSLFGGGAGGAPMGGGGPSLESYHGNAPTDIWHSNSPLNLFQIVSEKLTTVSTRVH